MAWLWRSTPDPAAASASREMRNARAMATDHLENGLGRRTINGGGLLLGAHIIKVKPPTAHVSLEAAKKTYETQHIDMSTLAKRVEHVVQACFNGKRLVVFSGGEARSDEDAIFEDIRQIRDGGGSGTT